jgi:hypothetical protein
MLHCGVSRVFCLVCPSPSIRPVRVRGRGPRPPPPPTEAPCACVAPDR